MPDSQASKIADLSARRCTEWARAASPHTLVSRLPSELQSFRSQLIGNVADVKSRLHGHPCALPIKSLVLSISYVLLNSLANVSCHLAEHVCVRLGEVAHVIDQAEAQLTALFQAEKCFVCGALDPSNKRCRGCRQVTCTSGMSAGIAWCDDVLQTAARGVKASTGGRATRTTAHWSSLTMRDRRDCLL